MTPYGNSFFIFIQRPSEVLDFFARQWWYSEGGSKIRFEVDIAYKNDFKTWWQLDKTTWTEPKHEKLSKMTIKAMAFVYYYVVREIFSWLCNSSPSFLFQKLSRKLLSNWSIFPKSRISRDTSATNNLKNCSIKKTKQAQAHEYI